MKVKTSVTLSEYLLKDLAAIAGGYKSRSDLIEEAVRLFLRERVKRFREEKDLKILNGKAKDLNEEAEDVLSYQADL